MAIEAIGSVVNATSSSTANPESMVASIRDTSALPYATAGSVDLGLPYATAGSVDPGLGVISISQAPPDAQGIRVDTPLLDTTGVGLQIQGASVHLGDDDVPPQTPSLAELIERLKGTPICDVVTADLDQLEIVLLDYSVPGVLTADQVKIASEALRHIAHLRIGLPGAVAEYDRLGTLATSPRLITLRNKLEVSTSHIEALRLQNKAVDEKIQQKKMELAALEAEKHGIVGRLHEAEGMSTALANHLAIEDRRCRSL